MSDSNNGWAMALALVVGVGAGLYAISRGGGQAQPQTGLGARPEPREPADDSYSNNSSSSDDSSNPAQPTAEERAQQAEAAKARLESAAREADEARSKREQAEKEAGDAKARREETEKQASEAKAKREKLERESEATQQGIQTAEQKRQRAQEAGDEGSLLSEVSDKTSKAMSEADSARLGTIRAVGEAIVTNLGGKEIKAVTSQVLGSIGVLEATKGTVEAAKKGDSVADPVISGMMSAGSKAANVMEHIPVLGNVVTGAQVVYAAGKDIKASNAADQSLEELATKAKESQNPQIAELPAKREQGQQQARDRRNERMAEGPMSPYDDYTFVQPLLDESHTNRALDQELTSGVKQASAEQVARASAEGKAAQEEAARLQAQAAKLQEETESARQAEQAAQDKAREAAAEEQSKAEAARQAAELEKTLSDKKAELEKESEPAEAPSSGGGITNFLAGLFTSTKNEVAAEEQANLSSQTQEESGNASSFSDDSSVSDNTSSNEVSQPSHKNEEASAEQTSEQATVETTTSTTKSEPETPVSPNAETGAQEDSRSQDDAIAAVEHYFGNGPYG